MANRTGFKLFFYDTEYRISAEVSPAEPAVVWGESPDPGCAATVDILACNIVGEDGTMTPFDPQDQKLLDEIEATALVEVAENLERDAENYADYKRGLMQDDDH